MTSNLTIITIILSSLFLSACETASQKVVSGTAATSKGSSSSVQVLVKVKVYLLKQSRQPQIN